MDPDHQTRRYGARLMHDQATRPSYLELSRRVCYRESVSNANFNLSSPAVVILAKDRFAHTIPEGSKHASAFQSRGPG